MGCLYFSIIRDFSRDLAEATMALPKARIFDIRIMSLIAKSSTDKTGMPSQ
jgi:hypothetical protein